MKKSVEQLINNFLMDWSVDEMTAFIRDLIPIFELYDVDLDDDWVEKEVGKENERNVRLIRTVYLISKFSENHAGRLCSIKANFPGLWKKMEKIDNIQS